MDKSLVRRLQRLEDPRRKAPRLTPKEVIAGLERELAETKEALDAARKPEDYWRQVAEATELSKKGLEQDNAIFKEERDALLRDIEKQNKDIDEHQARWQRAERQLAETRAALEQLLNYAVSVWFDEADAVDEEREEMQRARDALKEKDPAG
jgi:chromosome segregation ATPase